MTSDYRRNCLNLLAIASLVTLLCSSAYPAPRRALPGIRVCKDRDRCVFAEIAATPETRMRGLMFRHALSEGRGMLFVYPRSDYWNFWMKNTEMPLDIIWLDGSRRVVHIARDAQPCMREPCRIYRSGEKAAYVLELASGMSAKWRLGTGDRLIFRLPEDLVNILRRQ